MLSGSQHLSPTTRRSTARNVDEPGNARAYVYGAGGHSQVIADVLRDMGYSVTAFVNDYPNREHRAIDTTLPGVRVAALADFEPLDAPLVLGVGNNTERLELARMLGDGPSPLVEWISAIHSSAIIASTVRLGDDNVILHGSIIQANTRIGSHVLINTAASVDHDNVIGDGVHVSPHATLCGHVEVGEGTHIGAAATVIPSIRIGRWCTIGAGAVVTTDIPDHATAVGVPAKVIKIAD